ncbi:MAG: pentapeptide repeat-containing protein, partial [Dehalococcoidia bacterium]
GANFLKTDLTGANLQGVNLRDAQGLSSEQLSKVVSLYGVEDLAPDLKRQLEETHLHLLEKPIE